LITTGNARPIPQPIPHRDTASLASSFRTLPIPTLAARSVPALTWFGGTKIFRKADTPPLVKIRNIEFTFVPKIQAMCLRIPLCTAFCHLDAVARRASSPLILRLAERNKNRLPTEATLRSPAKSNMESIAFTKQAFDHDPDSSLNSLARRKQRQPR
jgi:hypothetical protein